MQECDLRKGLELYLYVKRTKIILINESLDDFSKQIVFAHEIGHAVLHTKETHAFSIDTMKKYKEREANIFCSELLDAIDFAPDVPKKFLTTELYLYVFFDE